MKNYQQNFLKIFNRIFRIGRGFSSFVNSFGIDDIPTNSDENKKEFTDDIGGYSYANSWCRTYNNGITSTEDANLRFSNGEYATKTSEGYYYFSNGITGYEDSYGDIHLSNGQVIIKK